MGEIEARAEVRATVNQRGMRIETSPTSEALKSVLIIAVKKGRAASDRAAPKSCQVLRKSEARYVIEKERTYSLTRNAVELSKFDRIKIGWKTAELTLRLTGQTM